MIEYTLYLQPDNIWIFDGIYSKNEHGSQGHGEQGPRRVPHRSQPHDELNIPQANKAGPPEKERDNEEYSLQYQAFGIGQARKKKAAEDKGERNPVGNPPAPAIGDCGSQEEGEACGYLN